MRRIEIIAEIGINHNGKMDLARELIYQAKNAGADAVKFQLYDPEKREDLETHKWKDILLQSRIGKRELYFLKQEADRMEIDFFCSVFDVKRVQWCESINVKRYKIASKSVYDKELVKAIADTDKPVIVSDGMLDERGRPEIHNPYQDELLRKPKWLYCVSEYPTDLEKLNFFDLDDYFPIFGNTHFGFSDHTVGISASVMAMSLGARMIEKHFTLDQTMDGPDHLLSVDPKQLKQLCSFRDDIEKI